MSKITPYKFEGASVRALEIDGEPWFVGKDVASVLGYANETDALNTHCRGVAKRYPIPDALGRPQETRLISEPDMLRLVVNSTLPAAERFERWVFEEVLPSIRKTGSYVHATAKQKSLTRTQVAGAIMVLRSAAEDLKLAPSAVLGGYQRLEAQIGVEGLLPAYAVDAPLSATGGSSEVTKSATDLLEQFEVDISTMAFNRLLTQKGFLEEHERPSSKGGMKKFKACANLEFGKNVTNPKNPKETQPHWYVSKFAALLALVLPAKPQAVA